MPREPWRYRQCPSCQEVFPAGELKVVKIGSGWNSYGTMLRRCPVCGRQGQTNEFHVVHNQHL